MSSLMMKILIEKLNYPPSKRGVWMTENTARNSRLLKKCKFYSIMLDGWIPDSFSLIGSYTVKRHESKTITLLNQQLNRKKVIFVNMLAKTNLGSCIYLLSWLFIVSIMALVSILSLADRLTVLVA
jgi:hypothetical protein